MDDQLLLLALFRLPDTVEYLAKLAGSFGMVVLGAGLFLYLRSARGGAGVRAEVSEGGENGWRAALSVDRGGPGLVFAALGAVCFVTVVLKGSEHSVEFADPVGGEASAPAASAAYLPCYGQVDAPSESCARTSYTSRLVSFEGHHSLYWRPDPDTTTRYVLTRTVW